MQSILRLNIIEKVFSVEFYLFESQQQEFFQYDWSTSVLMKY